ncbi:MAG: Phospho-N-acetylmuramoyl-pentapeptide-transferase [Chlamydiales bacterium]|nr:Phospho-N-acetylmuramoyl-pentapeptide-transferase [Chlamydiales bacterium]MCH9619860.1 Phospho-N-acetylmuramoyl-pentapeptide-transferase [Chlamydiales bacterium]MCH9622713.1 Phospho-N-acetylmuramoyl-pentapeptide-transferase [Chlamydiales bacterium]
MALAALTSLLFTILCGKPFIKKLYELKIGDRVRSEDCPLLGELHRDKNNTPTMGGILILSSLLLSLILWMDPKSPFTLILFLTTIVIGLLGAVDDYLKLRYKNKKGLSAKKKLLIQLGFSALVSLYLSWQPATEFIHRGEWFAPPIAKVESKQLTTKEYSQRLYIPFVKRPLSHMNTILMILFFMVVITGCSNAVNLTDGLDGLSTGTVMLSSAAFAVIAFLSNNIDFSNYLNIMYIEGSGEIAIYLLALAGACLGFLWYNSYPAQVFMGDTGALTLGAILGVCAVLLKREVLLALIGGIFVVEALSVILQVGSYKLRHKKRIFLCAPLHHHFEYQGWPETKVVIRFWIIGLLLSIVGIATLKFQ